MQKQQDSAGPTVYIADTDAFEIKIPIDEQLDQFAQLSAKVERLDKTFEQGPIFQTQRIKIPGRNLHCDKKGMSMSSFMERNKLSRSDVWQLIMAGELAARSDGKELRIFGELVDDSLNTQNSEAEFQNGVGETTRSEKKAFKKEKQRRIEAESKSDLSGRTASKSAFDHKVSAEVNFGTANPSQALTATVHEDTHDLYSMRDSFLASNDVALLLEHLSLAKEENKEILRLTQTSIEQITKITEELVTVKDEMISSQSREIDALKNQISAQSSELRKLKKLNEELQMLTDALDTGVELR